MECLALGMEAFKEEIVEILKELLLKDGILIRGVYERSDANERTKEGLPKVLSGMNLTLLWKLLKMVCIIL